MRPFLENKYTKAYYSIINNPNKCGDDYTESHHIIPKCMGGSDSKHNMVDLSAREHFLAHWLLTKMTNEKKYISKLWFAFHIMCFGESKSQKRYRPSSIAYSVAKREISLEHKNRKWIVNDNTGETKFTSESLPNGWRFGRDPKNNSTIKKCLECSKAMHVFERNKSKKFCSATCRKRSHRKSKVRRSKIHHQTDQNHLMDYYPNRQHLDHTLNHRLEHFLSNRSHILRHPMQPLL